MLQLPLLTPDSQWRRPTSLPNLSRVDTISLDLETCDHGLRNGRGPGWAHHAGYIIGVATAWEDQKIYIPVEHPDTECFGSALVADWVRELFSSRAKFVFHNAPYDLGWLWAQWGIAPPKNFDDTTAMAVMIDENRFSYQLDALCRDEGIVGKDEEGLKEAAGAYGFTGKDVKHNLFRLPARYVGPYAEADAVATLKLAEYYRPLLVRDDVMHAYAVEMGLIPMCLEMRKRGIRVDLEEAERALVYLRNKCQAELRHLSDQLGETVDMEKIRKSAWLESRHDAAKIRYPRTPKTGRGSFTAGKAGWMRKHPHWLPRGIASAERYAEAADKFVQGFIIDYAHQGRLHATINQFRGEEGGTRSHRFSYSDPPLQQMPERDDEIAPLIRGLFLPEEGQVWGVHDYSQQEYRIIVHCAAILKAHKADEAVRMYHDDPDTDFHNMVVEMTGLERKAAKDTNFAKAFGAGVRKFAQMIGRPEDEAKEIYDLYDEKLPFVSEASKTCSRKAEQRGYIKLVDGARCHFDFWLPVRTRNDQPAIEKMNPHRLGSDKYHEWVKLGFTKFKRGWAHKAFNRYVQGSAARQTKAAMLWCWRENLVPMLQMHDDLNFSLHEETQSLRVKEIMRDVIKLAVPVKVDSEYGPSWGLARKRDGYDASWHAAEELGRIRCIRP